jgi:hypothetical protein
MATPITAPPAAPGYIPMPAPPVAPPADTPLHPRARVTEPGVVSRPFMRAALDTPTAAFGGAAALSAAAAGTSPGAVEQVVRAHESLARAAARIAAQVTECVPVGRKVLVDDAEGSGLMAGFRAFRAQATLLQRAFDAVAPPPPPPPAPTDKEQLNAALGPAAASVAAAVKAVDALVLPIKHIAGLMQTHVSGLEARLVRADEAPLVAEIARHLGAAGRAVIYPRELPLELRDPLPALELIAATIEVAQRAAASAAARVAALDGPEKTRANAELAPLDAALTRMRKQLFELPDNSPAPSDVRALIEGAERVREMDAGAVLLVVRIAGAGSTPRAATAWHWKPAYSGGAVVSYFVATASAELLRSGTIADYTSFREPVGF